MQKCSKFEELIYKKHKVDTKGGLVVRSIGFKTNEFQSIRKYAFGRNPLPAWGSEFDERQSEKKGLRQSGKGVKAGSQSTQIIEQDINLFVNPIKHQFNVKELNSETFFSLAEVTRKDLTQQRERWSRMPLEKQEEVRAGVLRKAFERVVQCALKVQWLAQKEKIDNEMNAKKIALSCAKEVVLLVIIMGRFGGSTTRVRRCRRSTCSGPSGCTARCRPTGARRSASSTRSVTC